MFRVFSSLIPSRLQRAYSMKVVPVPVRSDNYAYLLIDEPSKQAAAVDPFDVGKVAAAAESEGVSIVAALTTHHHADHSGGNEKFAKTYPGAPIYGGSNQIPALTNLVKDKDVFKVGQNITIQCLATPCHTQDSICFYATAPTQPGGVFTGDTLFLGGCGRFFEGTAEEMIAALTYLGTLPDDTITYVGHEYTKGNVAFARSLLKSPEGPLAQSLSELENALNAGNGISTGRTTIGQEKTWNVFMRLQDQVVRSGAGLSADQGDVAIMAALREMKNNFRG